MEIKIELLIIILIFFVFLIWAVWFRLTRWKLRRKYKVENDIGKKEESSGRDNRREGIGIRGSGEELGDGEQGISGSSQSPERAVLEAADSIISRTDRKRSRGIFKRRRR